MRNFKTNKKLIVSVLAIGVIVIGIASLIIMNNTRLKDNVENQFAETNVIRLNEKIEVVKTQVAPAQKALNDKIEVKEVEKTNDLDPVVTDCSSQAIPLTKIDSTKQPPPPTQVIKHEESNEENKNVKPKSTPVKNKNKEPSAGEKNKKGQVFVPGFGWVEHISGTKGEASSSKGDINKQIGIMD